MAYVTSDVVAEIFGVSVQTVRNWYKRDPDFPRLNVGTKERPSYRFSIEDIKDYLQEGSK